MPSVRYLRAATPHLMLRASLIGTSSALGALRLAPAGSDPCEQRAATLYAAKPLKLNARPRGMSCRA